MPNRINSSLLCRRILLISDMHAPYHHPDTLDFLAAIKSEYEPTWTICVGDEVDKHAMSFHDSDPDLMSAGDELLKAIEFVKDLSAMFPEVDLVSSNHGDMAYRKAKHHGIPRKYIKDYGEVLDAPSNWRWHSDLLIELENGSDLYVCHGMKAAGLRLAESMGCNVVQGHYHSKFCIEYSSSPSQLIWSMQVGCSIDDRSLAFHYNKVTAARPILGHGIIINGQPRLLPMLLDENGRWIGKVV